MTDARSATVDCISHLTFLSADLDRARTFFCDGLGAVEVYDSTGRNFSLSCEKFFILGQTWIAVMEGPPPAERTYQHVAFHVDASALPVFKERLQAIGVDVRPPRPRVEGEGESLYFYDFDNHLFELHTGTLQERLHRYARR